MSKSVLVMDTPETCLDCMFCFELDEGINACCSVMSDKGLCRDIQCDGGYCQSKPNWCPLKEVPEEVHNDYKYDEYCDGYDDGWNGFRGRILGENNNV